jgi:hypothetical protein
MVKSLVRDATRVILWPNSLPGLHLQHGDAEADLMTVVKNLLMTPNLGRQSEQIRIGLHSSSVLARDRIGECLGNLFNVKICMEEPLLHKRRKILGNKEERDFGVRVSINRKPSAQCTDVAQTANLVHGHGMAFHYKNRHLCM